MEEKKLKVNRRINWSEWEQYSKESLRMDTALECCNCTKRGQYNCDCEIQDRQAWLNDVTYIRKFEPPPVRPVNKNGALVIDEYGLIRGPYLYEQWRHYSYHLLDYFHDIVEGKTYPNGTGYFSGMKMIFMLASTPTFMKSIFYFPDNCMEQ